LFSLVTVFAHHLALATRRAAWYAKPLPTFSDAIAAVRHALWRHPTLHTSCFNRHIAKMPQAVFGRFADALCHSS
jgi:hypothetical protein